MRKLLYFLAAVCLWTGCSDEYDDSAIKGDIDDLKEVVEELTTYAIPKLFEESK